MKATRTTQLYFGSILIAGLVIALLTWTIFDPAQSNWMNFLLLTTLASLTQLLKSEAPYFQVYHPSLVFFFAGILVLQPFGFVILVLFAHAVELIKEKLNAVGLNYKEFSGRYPSEFSGGQLQRISIARALLTDPTLLIADEPVSMVDASLRMSIVNLFKALRDRLEVSVLYITHDLATAYYVSDRIAIMFRGQIVEMGPVEDVLMSPRHAYTRLLRESVPEADPTKRWSERISLTELEHEEYLRRGCKFEARCPYSMPECGVEMPQDIRIGDVFVKCYLYTEDEETG